jgi:predicted amidohydrolase YtcJ
MNFNTFSIAVFVLLFVTLNSFSQKKTVDLIVKNATIYTVDKQFSQASVMVVDAGKVKALGNKNLLKKFVGLKTIDAKGKFIYPGFIDAHCHFTGYSMDEYKLNLYGSSSFTEMIERTVEYAKNNKRNWIEGRLWNENDWEAKTFPTKDTLDKLFPNTPVFLMRIDGHAVLCNQKAFDIAGINAQTKIEDGAIEKKNGKLTGIIIDKAVDLVKSHIPKLTQAEATKFFQTTEQQCFLLGLTSLIDCGLDNEIAHWLQNSYMQKSLSIRIAIMLMDDAENFEEFLYQKPIRNKNFHIIGFKIFADGSLGSRGAYLLQDYDDQHNHHGYLLKSIEVMKRIAQKVYQSKYQLNVHAIGDGANHEVLKIFSSVLKKKNDRRWRIEHAQVVNPSDLHYFKQFSIIPSVQPTHATSDMAWAESRIGKRIKHAYAYQNLLQTNGWLPLGTDFPVESFNPLHTFYAAVFRQNALQEPAKGFQQENALTRKQALQGITIWAAKSAFEENEKGSLEVGKFADFVILPIDLMRSNATSIYRCNVEQTFVAGKCVFDVSRSNMQKSER